jgi:integrase
LTGRAEESYSVLMAVIKRGNVYCSSCGVRVRPVNPKKEYISCQACGHPNVHIRLMFEGEPLRIYLKDGKPYSYSDAVSDLITINQQIKEKTFDPREWLPVTAGEKSFRNIMAAWLERKELECDKDKLAPSTLGNYQTYNRKYYQTSDHLNRDIREIKLKHLQLFYDDLPGSSKYRKNIIDGLHTFFRWALRWGEIESIPIWPEMEDVIQKERFALTYEEQQTALSNIPAEHRDIFEFMMETGLRPGEACALQWIDIDFKMRRALIRRTYSESELRQKTKQKKEQWIPLSDRACELIERQRGCNEGIVESPKIPEYVQGEAEDFQKRVRVQNTFKDGTRPTVSDLRPPFLFINPDTKRGYRYKVLNRLWNKHSGTSVDLYEGTRHSFCTQMVEMIGVDNAQKAMRHTDRRSTARYDHSGDAKIRDAMNQRSKVIPFKKAGDE